MNHKFKHICTNKKALLQDVYTLSSFMRRVEKCSADEQWAINNWSPEDYKGFSLEALAEILITNSPLDKRIGIVDYRPADPKVDGRDMGIDGYGRSHDGKLHTIQMKYVSDTRTYLTANNAKISNFVSKTTSSPIYKDADMTIITTARGLNQVVNEFMYHNRVRVLGYKELSKLIDDNIPFWDLFRKEMGC
jgi:hypothetical protein